MVVGALAGMAPLDGAGRESRAVWKWGGVSAPSQDQGATHTQEKHEPLQELLTRVERQIVRQRLREHGGRRNATARSLGVTREGLWKKLKRLDIE